MNSNASHTQEFLQSNFDEQQDDLAYVTASPQVAGYEDMVTHIEHVWQDRWDKDLRTVPPTAVTDAALSAIEQHPNKRLLVHYMQPRYSFIGETGKTLSEQTTFTGGLTDREYTSVWEQLSEGDIDSETVWTAYRENLEPTLQEVERLAGSLEGKTVITSDHGICL